MLKFFFKISKNSKNPANFKKIQKKHTKNERKNAILLVLPIEGFSLQPELARPPHFRIQRGVP